MLKNLINLGKSSTRHIRLQNLLVRCFSILSKGVIRWVPKKPKKTTFNKVHKLIPSNSSYLYCTEDFSVWWASSGWIFKLSSDADADNASNPLICMIGTEVLVIGIDCDRFFLTAFFFFLISFWPVSRLLVFLTFNFFNCGLEQKC